MTDNVFDVIVVGSGIEGSATAYYLTTNHTKNVLVLEQVNNKTISVMIIINKLMMFAHTSYVKYIPCHYNCVQNS